MKHALLTVSILAGMVLALPTGSTIAGDTMLMGESANGKKLHQANCIRCHDQGVYLRKDRRIHSIEGLQGQVAACNSQLDTRFSGDQVNDVIKFLNETYYKF